MAPGTEERKAPCCLGHSGRGRVTTMRCAPRPQSVLLERKGRIVSSSLSHRSPLCLPGEGRLGPWAGGTVVGGVTWQPGFHLRKAGLMPASCVVRAGRGALGGGTGVDKEQRL